MFCEMSWRNHSPNHVWDGVIRFQPEDQILLLFFPGGGGGKDVENNVLATEDSRE